MTKDGPSGAYQSTLRQQEVAPRRPAPFRRFRGSPPAAAPQQGQERRGPAQSAAAPVPGGNGGSARSRLRFRLNHVPGDIPRGAAPAQGWSLTGSRRSYGNAAGPPSYRYAAFLNGEQASFLWQPSYAQPAATSSGGPSRRDALPGGRRRPALARWTGAANAAPGYPRERPPQAGYHAAPTPRYDQAGYSGHGRPAAR